MSHDPAVDVRSHIISSSVGTSSVFVGPVRPAAGSVPAKAVFIVPTGGPGALRILGTAHEHRTPAVQIRVRSTSYASGASIAHNVHDAMQSANISGYLDSVVQQSEPVFLEQDENNFYHWSVNCQLLYTT